MVMSKLVTIKRHQLLHVVLCLYIWNNKREYKFILLFNPKVLSTQILYGITKIYLFCNY